MSSQSCANKVPGGRFLIFYRQSKIHIPGLPGVHKLCLADSTIVVITARLKYGIIIGSQCSAGVRGGLCRITPRIERQLKSVCVLFEFLYRSSKFFQSINQFIELVNLLRKILNIVTRIGHVRLLFATEEGYTRARLPAPHGRPRAANNVRPPRLYGRTRWPSLRFRTRRRWSPAWSPAAGLPRAG